MILDIYSRKIVGFEVHATDSADHAAHLAKRTALAEGVHATPVKPVPHGDNGATLKATTVLAMLHWLGIKPSYSRPRVSDDNPLRAMCGRPLGCKRKNEKSAGRFDCDHVSGLLTRHHVRWPRWGPRSTPKQ